MNSQELLSNYLAKSIKQDHYEFLFSIYKKYGHIGNFTFNQLLEQYPLKQIQVYKNINQTIDQTIDETIDKTVDETIDQNIKSRSLNNSNESCNKYCNKFCIGRIWGHGSMKIVNNKDIYSIGTYIKYNKKNKKWIYGTQCSRKNVNNSQFCGIHLRQIEKYNSLTHGTILEDPPHNHYDKFAIRILKHIAIQKSNN